MTKTKAKAKTDKPEAMEGNDACMLMHTALRKCCDSKITSSVYNLIHLIDLKPEKYDPWRMLGQLVADRLSKGEDPTLALKAAHAELEDKFLDLWCDDKQKGANLPDDARTWLYALSCAMHCFGARDWEGMASFLSEED